MNEEFQRTERRGKKDLLKDQCKEQRKTIEWETLEISSRKLAIQREYFMLGWHKKRTEVMVLIEAEGIKKR